jgi:hypothetical protein
MHEKRKDREIKGVREQSQAHQGSRRAPHQNGREQRIDDIPG